MGSNYTSNGRHKDDPTNPESHWNDWSINRDGNKLRDNKTKNKNIKEIECEIEKEINRVNEELIKCYKEISQGRLDTFGIKVRELEGKKEGLQLALGKFK